MELDILNAWEQAFDEQPCARELALLSLVYPEISGEQALNLSIGQKNAFLSTVRELLFGTEMTGIETCPSCGETLEVRLFTSDLRPPELQGDDRVLSFCTHDYDISFRVPVCSDIIACSSDDDAVSDRDSLLCRCIFAARKRGTAIAPDELPDEIKDALIERMAECDDQAETHVSLTCPACGHDWKATFDIGLFLWEELSAWVNRTLYEIHVLASAYGWSEREILEISPLRRQHYLAQVNQ